MVWETVAAILLIVGTFPIWFFIGIFWGLISAFLAFLTLAIDFLGGANPDWGQIWVVPLGAIIRGFEAAWHIPSSIWHWAKFDHPVWAAVIGMLCLGAANSNTRR
jgi:hypothetical protein